MKNNRHLIARCIVVRSMVVALGASLANIAMAATLTRGPYLQTGTVDGVTVCWRSDVATNSVVRIGTDPGNLNMTFTNASTATSHFIPVSGLAAQTRYYYSVGSSSETLSLDTRNTFITSPVTGMQTPFRVWVIGDAGTGTSSQAAVYSAYRNFTGSAPTHFWLQLGDNAYLNGTDTDYRNNMFNRYPDLLRQSVTWPTLGNHDGISANSSTQSGPYYSIFSLPANAQAGGIASGTEAYYSFDYGNAHFVVLDSSESPRSVGGAMYNWVQADLQANSADWLIALWHHAPYTHGSHNSDTDTTLTMMRQNFVPLFESYGVDLVLSGHSHSYERSRFIHGHTGLASTFSQAVHVVQSGSGRVDDTGAYTKAPGNSPGTVYAVAGSSGQIGGGTLDHPAMYTSLNVLGSMVLDFNGLTMNARFLGSNGAIRDYFTITKAGSVPVSTVSGRVWNDANANGLRESGEQPLSNISVGLYDNTNTLTASQTTDASGNYSFTNVTEGGYSLQFNAAGYTFSPQDQGSDDSIDSDAAIADGRTTTFSVTAGSSVGNMDAGLYLPIGSATTLRLQDGVNGYAGTTDAYVASGRLTTNYGAVTALRADGSDGAYGRQVALLRWDVSTIPATASIVNASLAFDVLNSSTGPFDVYAVNVAWTEAGANWSNTLPESNQGVLIGSFTPASLGSQTLTLNSVGLSLIRGWADGSIANNGIMIIDRNNTDGLVIAASEYDTAGSRPLLSVTYE